ncbi:MAG: hypothetical protein PHO37_00240 [Kiritimatiellae bacterium]|nr:hypothetical protein [Kiritimatiellia bacterium]
MGTTIDITKEITKYLSCELPQFPVMVSESPEDSMALWVQVFCVTSDQEELVEETIFNAQEKFYPTGEIMFLPMVKSLAITKQYYPEHLPTKSVASQIATPIDLLKITSAISAEWSMLNSATQSEAIVTDKDGNFKFAA